MQPIVSKDSSRPTSPAIPELVPEPSQCNEPHPARCSKTYQLMTEPSAFNPMSNTQAFMGSNTPPHIQARMEVAKTYFNDIQWRPHRSKKAALETKMGDKLALSVPAIQVKTQIAAKPESIYFTMLDHIHEYENWLPIIKSMKVVETPSANERILSVETHGKFGMRGGAGLAQATFHQEANEWTQVHITQLPLNDLRYDNYPNLRNSQMKCFETFMEFTPSKDKPGSVDLQYENHTDPNISKALRFMVASELMNNHETFVEKCSSILVNSPHNT